MSLADFRLTGELGKGSMGVVLGGVHELTGVRVAIKTMHPSHRGHDLVLERELSAMARLNHPHVLFLYDHGTAGPNAAIDEGMSWMALEYAGGGSLEAVRPAKWAEVRGWTVAVLDGLAHAHARGLVHRDLKPGNLMWCGPDAVRPGLKIADFGLAWAIDHDHNGLKRAGTPAYIAPEQARGAASEFGPWTDLYALGCILWEWVTGDPPFGWDRPDLLMAAHQRATLPPLEPRLATPPGLEALLRSLLEKDPEARPQSAEEVTQEISALLGSGGASTGTLIPVRKKGDRRRPPVPKTWFAHEPRRSNLLAGAGLALLTRRDLRVVGRREERDALWSSLRQVAANSRVEVLALLGPSQVGRSHLARWVMVRARELGAAEGLRFDEDHLPGEWAERRAPGEGPFQAITAAAAAGPVVVWVDDSAQNAELEALITTALFSDAAVPVLFVTTGRNGEGLWEDLGYLSGFSSIDVEPLPLDSMIDVARYDLGLSRGLATRLAEEASGRPGLLVRWVQRLFEDGSLRPTADGYTAESVDLGRQSSDEVVRTRMNRALQELRPDERLGVALAALLGLEVRWSEWRTLLRLLQCRAGGGTIKRLSRFDLVNRHQMTFAFAGPVVREYAMDLLGRSDLDGYHLAAAAALGQLKPNRDRRRRRALHLLKAGQTVRACRELSPIFQGFEANGDWVRLEAGVLEVHRHGDVDSLPLPLRLSFARFHLQVVRRRYTREEALPLLDAALEMLEVPEASDLQSIAVPILTIGAEMYIVLGRSASASALLERIPDGPEHQRLQALLYIEQDRYLEAHDLMLKLYETVPEMQAQAANGLGMIAGSQQRYDDAILWFERCRDASQQALRRHAAITNMALVCILKGEYRRAADLAWEGQDIRGGLGAVQTRGYHAVIAAIAAAGAGDLPRFRMVVDPARYHLQRHGLVYPEIVGQCLSRVRENAPEETRGFLEGVQSRLSAADSS